MTRDPDRTRTHHPTSSIDPALDAGLAAAFGPGGPSTGGWSAPPLLRDDPSDHAPLVRTDSPDMPKADPGRYQLLGELARGGMGVVLKGRDPDLGRDLAVKVLRAELAGKPAAVDRFVEEAQVCGQLQHPGVIPVYELGRFPNGQPFFTMKLVKGRTLAALLAERAHPGEDRGRFLKVFEQVCQTMAYAHAKGVIHRDLKPANVMVGSFGEVQVMDWGLAKVIPQGGIADELKATHIARPREVPAEFDPTVIRTARVGSIGSFTEAGSVMGSPAFMPPEQAGGEIDKLDERADVFGLGAVLCVILTGKPPYVADDSDAVRLMAIRGKLDDALARLAACGADTDLIGLATRCLAAERDDRPRNARDVAATVSGYLASVEARARQAEVERAQAEARAEEEKNTRRIAEEKTAEQRKRRKVQAALGLALTALVALGGIGLWWQERQSADRRAERQVEGARARQVAETALEQAEAALRAEKMPEADAALAVARQRLPDADAPDLRDRFEAARKDREMVRELDDIAEQRWTVSGEDMTVSAAKAKAKRRYADAFRRYGLTVGAEPPESTADAVARSRVSAALAVGLGEWFFLDPNVPGLAPVLDKLDPDALRAEVRAAVAAGQDDRVRELAARLDGAKLPPGFAVALGKHQALSDDESGRLMRAAWESHPDSFPLALEISIHVGSPGRKGRRWDPARAAESVAWARTAVALRPGNAVAYRNLGLALEEGKDRPKALAAYRRAIELAPRFPRAHEALVRALGEMNDLEGAFIAARRVVEVAADNADSWHALGHAHLDRKDYPGAIAAFREAIARRDSEARDHFCLGNALSRNRNLDEAISAYREAIRLDPKDVKARGGLGRALRDTGDTDGAITVYKEAIGLDPTDAATHYNLGAILCDVREDYDAAIACFRKAIQLNPEYDQAQYCLGLALSKKGDAQGAIAAFKDVLRLDRNDARAVWGLGIALRQFGEVDEAIACFLEAIDLDPKDFKAHFNLATAMWSQRNFDGAIAYIREAIRLRPTEAASHNNLGAMLWEWRQDADECIPHYREALRLDPTYARAHHNLAVALTHKGDFDGAIEHYRTAVRLNSTFWDCHYNLGILLSDKKQDYDGAIAAYREAIRLKPKDARAYFNLGNTLCHKKDFDGAIAAYRAAIRFNPKYSRPHHNLGTVLYYDLKRDFDEAIVCYRKAIELDPNDARAHFNLGVALCYQKREFDAGIACFNESIRLDPKTTGPHNGLSWLLATGPDEVRDGKRAVEHGIRACELSQWKVPMHIGTLGTAYAEAGDFDKAIECQKRAFTFEGYEEKYGAIGRELLDFYARKEPYRDPHFAPREAGPQPRAVK